jgi:hypothetical protein
MQNARDHFSVPHFFLTCHSQADFQLKHKVDPCHVPGTVQGLQERASQLKFTMTWEVGCHCPHFTKRKSAYQGDNCTSLLRTEWDLQF